jgi:hypothetical protein
MICINPMAPRARRLAPLSTCITARIQCSGTLKRLDASVTNAAKGWRLSLLALCAGGDTRPACAAPLYSIDHARIITKHSTVPRDRKAAIALVRRLDGRP